MIIPSKHSGYQAGIRLYPGDGGGGDGGGGTPDAGPASGTDAGAGMTGGTPGLSVGEVQGERVGGVTVAVAVIV